EASLTGAAPLPLKIFATDVNGASVNKARTGIYSRAIAAAVSPARLQRHFIEVEQGYRVAAPIRELCIFAEHDLLTDPPFSHIDLLVCRNLLIYLDSSLQERVIPVLHGALRPGGDLWLGPSEVPGRHEDRFEREDPRHRFFRRKSEAGRPPGRRHPTEHQAEDPVPRRRDPPGLPGSSAPVADARREADNLLLARYAPPSVLVNAHLDVVQFRGDASPYLAQGAGSGGANLLKMAHAELLVALRNLVERARVEGLPVREERLSFPIGDEQRHVRVEASPIRGPEHFAEHVLVSFEELEPISQASPAGTDADGTAGRPRAAPTGDHKRLLHELAATREYLKSIIEQQLATNQDLQSSSEENQSANEELQSINEELETSKEEVQAANEELTTVNDELRERNAELASSNADFLNLLDSVQISIIMLDRDLRIRRFTPPAEKLLSLIAADIGRPIGDIRITLDVPDLQPLLLDVLTTGAVKELTVRTQSGRWHSLRLHPYQTLQRVTQGVVIVLVDVDPLKTAQEQLRASEERHRLLVDGATGYAIMMLDADGIITSWNAGAQRIFGFPDVEIVGQHVSRLYTPEDRARALSSEELLHARQEAGATHEAWLVRKDGSRFWASGSTTALRAPSGALRGYGKIVRDNTDRKRFEEQLQLHVAELAETDRFRTEFLAMLAHEFRNPLAAVRNATDVLDTAHVPPGVATRAHELMRRQIANMSRMIDDLLDVTRVSHGKIHLHKQVVDLVPVLKNAADVHSAALAERGQTLGLSVPAEPVLVMGDATRLEQAVGNLIHNASKYGHDGGHIWVELEEPPRGAEPAAPETLRVIRVRDDGVGIEPALLSRVFDLFTQADQSLARGRGGLGIGLTLARRLVELHGGTLEATSPGPELGSVFTVRLPTGALILPRAAARPAARRSRGGIPRSVLVVDDNEDAAESLAMLLRLAGHHVHVALGPDQALAALGERFDVALLDIGMPGTNGLELAQAMRSRLGEHCPTLIALTGYGHEEMRHDVKAAGFSQHLLKPADPQLLLDILASVKAG
ncbi:MAG TPA: CheR family methyltransferase, partial [Planctomycetota bacterium]|nr:CheR family methyltransferase [Planctomycetota bacterium]